MIKVKSLRVDYENVTAVDDLDLEIPAGQIYGLVGPNGAGKTSTLKAIAGIIEPTYGEIEINGFDLELQTYQALQQMAFMPDFSPVYENLTVGEYLQVFAAAYLIKEPQRTKIAREWAERVNIQEKWNAYIKELSRGMRQRLVLAKTLLSDPKVILLDEPASGLDPIARIELRTMLKDIASKNHSIMISSHILTELSDLCNAIGIMEKGHMVISGSLETIRAAIGIKNQLMIHSPSIDEHAKQTLLGVLAGFGQVVEPKETRPGKFCCGFSGNETQAAELLSSLMHNNISISQFYMKEADMEDIFLKIGAKEIS